MHVLWLYIVLFKAWRAKLKAYNVHLGHCAVVCVSLFLLLPLYAISRVRSEAGYAREA